MAKRVKSIPVRLPENIYEAIKSLSADSGVSMNAIIVESVAEKLKVREARALYDSFTLLGQDADSDVEFAFESQREAIGD